MPARRASDAAEAGGVDPPALGVMANEAYCPLDVLQLRGVFVERRGAVVDGEDRVACLGKRAAEDLDLAAGLLLGSVRSQRRVPAASRDVNDSVPIRALRHEHVHEQRAARNHPEDDIALYACVRAGSRWGRPVGGGPSRKAFLKETHHRSQVVRGVLGPGECGPVAAAGNRQQFRIHAVLA